MKCVIDCRFDFQHILHYGLLQDIDFYQIESQSSMLQAPIGGGFEISQPEDSNNSSYVCTYK